MYTEVMQVIKAVIFDMYETLITLFDSPLYFGTQMASNAGIAEERFQETWRAEEKNRTTENHFRRTTGKDTSRK